MNIKSYIQAFTLFIVLASCNPKPVEEINSAFSLSDEMALQLEFKEAKLEDVKNEIRLFGKIDADNNKIAEVNSIVSGVVKSIHVGLGDYVKQGQILAVIQSSEVASFQKEKLDAMNDMAIAEKNLQVAKDLFEGKLNSEKDLILAKNELAKAKAELSRINDIHSIYKLKSGSTYNILAPFNGFIINKDITINDNIKSDRSEPLFFIADIKEIWAIANVNESDISKIKTDYDVTVSTLAFPDHPYDGKIEKIYSVIDPETRAMKIRVRIPNFDFKLKPEMNCTVNVRYKENHKMVAIPSEAVIFDKNRYWVMIYKDKFHVDTREVEVYRNLNGISYLSSGVSDGEQVIAKGGLMIYNTLND
ncbi:efflux RND transporter periplasmic adaptor subunit [Pseudopedobacter sp.]|uniref:efflux RND transporter periplasmic adaptor subunit n=1 Tax=Pseudopedobacter sp. TaxID=1936787 RepID=UPI00333EC4E8